MRWIDGCMKGFFGWHVAASSHPWVSSLEMLSAWGSTHDEAEAPWDIAWHSLHAHDCSVTPSSDMPQPMARYGMICLWVEARKSVLATARSIQSYKGRVFMRTWTLLSRRWSPRTGTGYAAMPDALNTRCEVYTRITRDTRGTRLIYEIIYVNLKTIDALAGFPYKMPTSSMW